MKSLSKDKVLRWVSGTQSQGGSGGGGGSVDVAGYATQIWTEQNYVNKEFFSSLFKAYDANGNEVLPNDTETVIDNIKAMFGFWTEQYVSALGQGTGGGGGGGASALSDLLDVEINNPTNGQSLVYDSALSKWVNAAGSGVDMDTVWRYLAQSSTQQIDISHLTNALSGYVTTSAISDMATKSWVNLQGFATQTWVNQNFITIAFFDRLFQAYEGTGSSAIRVNPNDTTSTIDNIKAMFGFWTEQYISALGQGTGGGGGGGASALSDLLDVEINNPTNGQSLVYDSALSKWVNAAGSGVDMETVWRYLAQSSTQQIDISHLTTALSGYALTSQLPTKDSWNYDDVYVKLSGSTITGRIVRSGGGPWISGRDNAVVFGSSYGQAAGNSWNTVWSQKTTSGAWTAGNLSGDNYLMLVYDTDANYNVGNNQATHTIIFPLASGTVALTSQIPDVSNFITNGSWITVNNDGLYVNGSNGWIRTYGSCGWYSQSHGGGWYMEDDTWIRSYNGKYVYISSNLASEHIYAGGGSANLNYALYINGVGYASSGLYSAGYVTALSDARHKTIISDAAINVEQIARMPAVVYQWNDGREDNGLHVGSIAQDWQRVLPEVVMKANDEEGTLSMQYGVAALVSSIITARKVVDHERRIAELERENKELKMKLNIA